MENYRAEDIIRERRRRDRQRRARDSEVAQRQKEIAYYLIYTTTLEAARELERLGFPTEGSTIYEDINEGLVLPDSTQSRTGWRLATIGWSARTWNLYILQGGVLVMQDTEDPRQVRVVPRDCVRRYVRDVKDLIEILDRLRRLASILVSHPLKLAWWQYPGFWLYTS